MNCKLSLIPLLIALLWTVSPARAANAVVGSGTPASCTEATFTAALATANTGGGVITFNCGSDPHTILFSSTKTLQNGVELDGAGLITLDGDHITRLFQVAGTAVILRNLTLQNGSVSGNGGAMLLQNGSGALLQSVLLTNHTADGNGGALYVSNNANLTLQNSQLKNNSASANGGAVYVAGSLTLQAVTVQANTANHGAGIYANAGNSLLIENSTLQGNTSGSSYSGGGVYAFAMASLTLNDSLLEGNQAGYGGGLYLYQTPSALQRVTFRQNTANNLSGAGGGLLVIGALSTSVSVADSTFDGNSALQVGGGLSGGAIYNQGVLNIANSTFVANQSANGGAIINTSTGILSMQNSTLSGNTANIGAGIFNSGELTLHALTIANNHAAASGGGIYLNSGASAQLSLTNTLLADNTAPDSNSTQCKFLQAPVLQQYTLASDSSCGASTSNGNLPNTPARLSPLSFTYTGLTSEYTQTLRPYPDSPALNAGTCIASPATDQRGVARPFGGACDIGAVEYANENWLVFLPLILR
jgi:predicted outer membrane repeat protein